MPNEHDLLLVIDVQNDFCSGGALAVPDGEAVVPLINRLAGAFAHIVLTQDWHPADHLSFASQHPGRQPLQTIRTDYGDQTLWPDHCVAGTAGADFHPALRLDRAELVVRKGFRRGIDFYSAFRENDRSTPTGLAGYLRERGFAQLFLAGLATDFCVAFTALDARAAGFDVTIVEDCCRAIDLDGFLERAWLALAKARVARAWSGTAERS